MHGLVHFLFLSWSPLDVGLVISSRLSSIVHWCLLLMSQLVRRAGDVRVHCVLVLGGRADENMIIVGVTSLWDNACDKKGEEVPPKSLV